MSDMKWVAVLFVGMAMAGAAIAWALVWGEVEMAKLEAKCPAAQVEQSSEED